MASKYQETERTKAENLIKNGIPVFMVANQVNISEQKLETLFYWTVNQIFLLQFIMMLFNTLRIIPFHGGVVKIQLDMFYLHRLHV